MTTQDAIIAFPADHPALAGHFPGDPLVPGAVLLDHVAATLAEREGQRVTAIRNAKFLRPLKAGESCRLRVSQRADGAFNLTCSVGGATVMTAVLETAKTEASGR